MSQSTRSTKAGKLNKPAKPHADFPLFAHNNGLWAKKVKGRLHYFGKWADDTNGERAINLWLDRKDDLLAGRTPREDRKAGEPTLTELANAWLTVKKDSLDGGEITPRTFGEYFATAERVLEAFGKNRLLSDIAPDDFRRLRASLAKTRGPVSLSNEMTRVKMLFRFAFVDGLDGRVEKPVRYGQSFEKPKAKTVRKARAENGKKMLEADELRRILDHLHDNSTLKAATLLGINAGFGAWDIANMPMSALDLDGGWVTFPRPKTGVERRAKLWPETVDALRDVLENRPKPLDKDDANIAFLTPKGKRWVRASQATDDPAKWRSRTDLLGKDFGKVLRALHINGRRGLGLYSLRHTFQTVAEESKDMPAVAHVMGHADASMAAKYRERFADSRLEAVAETVRLWLFGEGGAA